MTSFALSGLLRVMSIGLSNLISSGFILAVKSEFSFKIEIILSGEPSFYFYRNIS